jgi:hypothetical protein
MHYRRIELIIGILIIFFGVLALLANLNVIDKNVIVAVILWIIAIGFLFIYLKFNQHWWAIIPAGVFFTIGTMVFIDALYLLRHNMRGVVFFLGISFTFFSVWSQSSPAIQLRWARYPAMACLTVAFFLFLEATPSLGVKLFIPVILLSTGVYIVVRSLRTFYHKESENS